MRRLGRDRSCPLQVQVGFLLRSAARQPRVGRAVRDHPRIVCREIKPRPERPDVAQQHLRLSHHRDALPVPSSPALYNGAEVVNGREVLGAR